MSGEKEEVSGTVRDYFTITNVSAGVVIFLIGLGTGFIAAGPGGNNTGVDDVVAPETAGMKTQEFVNSNIFQPSPNDVRAELVNVSDGSKMGLPNFYVVNMNVTNPAGSQITEVYTRKDAGLVFLQFPRKMGEGYDPLKYR